MSVRNNIKVLFVTHYKELYGANRSLLQMILELREKGVDPTVMLPSYGNASPGNNLAAELEKMEIPYIETPIRFDKHGDWKKVLANYIISIFYKKKAYLAIKGIDFDLVHSNSSVISVGAYIADKLNVPHIWHIREFGDLDYGLKTPFGRWFQRILYRGKNTFIAISKKVKEYYQPYIGNQDIRLIYNGIAPFQLNRSATGDKVEFCIVGLIQAQKGHEELLEAAKVLVSLRGIKNFHINIIGGGYQPCVDHISECIRKMELTEYVSMLGRRSDVTDLLAKMDVGIMASSHEAFGRVTVEYMMAGLPVIASDGGANTEIVKDHETGLIYQSGDSLSLADKMEFLINNPSVRESYGAKGLELALKGFSSKANSDAVYGLYKEFFNK